MRAFSLLASTVALLTIMQNSGDDACGARGEKRALDIESEAEPFVDEIHSWMLADWQTNEGGAA